jgi:hypothetical protein
MTLAYARARLPQARFVRPAGCGHVPMTDDPALVAEILLCGSSGPTRWPGAARSP